MAVCWWAVSGTQSEAFSAFLTELGYRHEAETDSAAYQLFLN